MDAKEALAVIDSTIRMGEVRADHNDKEGREALSVLRAVVDERDRAKEPPDTRLHYSVQYHQPGEPKCKNEIQLWANDAEDAVNILRRVDKDWSGIIDEVYPLEEPANER